MSEPAQTVWPSPPWIPAGAWWEGEPGRSALVGEDGLVIPVWFDNNGQAQPERRRVPCAAVGCAGTVL